MTINIDKRFFSIRLKYDILVDGVQEFLAKADIFHVPYKPQLSLYDLSENRILFIKLASPFYFEYDLIFTDGEKVELRLEENSYHNSYFNYHGDRYTIHFNGDYSISLSGYIGGFNKEVSICRNGSKIASFIREEKYDDYVITCDDDANKILMIIITLAFDFHLRKMAGSRYS